MIDFGKRVLAVFDTADVLSVTEGTDGLLAESSIVRQWRRERGA